MSKKIDRKEMRKEFKKRMDESRRGREARKVRGKGVFNTKGYDDLKFYDPSKGKHVIDTIPYRVGIDNHPSEDREGIIPKGEIAYALVFARHTRIGPEQMTVVCPRQTFGDPCPICEEMASGEYDDDEMAAMRPRWRSAYNIVDKDDEDEGIQIFHVSATLFQDELWDEHQEMGEDGPIFFDPSEGCSISFRASPAKMGKIKYMEFKSFGFVEREKKGQYEDDVVDQAYPLDEMLIVYSYEELEKIMHGKDEEEVTESSEEDDRKPKGKGKAIRGRKPGRDEKEKEDPDDDDNKEKEVEDDECPHGHEFGKDCDEEEECEECENWKACADAQKEEGETEEEEEKPKKGKGLRRTGKKMTRGRRG